MRDTRDKHSVTRREVLKVTAAGCGVVMAANAGLAVPPNEANAAAAKEFALNFMLATCMYGYMYVGEILPEVAKCSATTSPCSMHGSMATAV